MEPNISDVTKQIESILKILDESANLQTKAWLELEELRRQIGGFPVPVPIIEEPLEMMTEEEIAEEMANVKKSEHKITTYHMGEDAFTVLDDPPEFLEGFIHERYLKKD
tara:strand:- start:355 stop:681 length:327 start_codon:yes stop_codon:yes gene_type:complete